MKKTITLLSLSLLVLSMFANIVGAQERDKLDKIEEALKSDIPNLLCLDENFATAGQPTRDAFAKVKANGFKSVLNLRTEAEGADKEKEVVEQAGLVYINVPFASRDPKPEVVDGFIAAVKNKDNHPMLIHCGTANRVGALWMIYRVVEHGWAEDKALEEAERIGLTSPALKSFAREYIAGHKK